MDGRTLDRERIDDGHGIVARADADVVRRTVAVDAFASRRHDRSARDADRRVLVVRLPRTDSRGAGAARRRDAPAGYRDPAKRRVGARVGRADNHDSAADSGAAVRSARRGHLPAADRNRVSVRGHAAADTGARHCACRRHLAPRDLDFAA